MLHPPVLTVKEEWRAMRIWLVLTPLLGCALYLSGWARDYEWWIVATTVGIVISLLVHYLLIKALQHRYGNLIWWGATTTYFLGWLMLVAGSGGQNSPLVVGWALFPLRMIRGDAPRWWFISYSVAMVLVYVVVTGIVTPDSTWQSQGILTTVLCGVIGLQVRAWLMLQRLRQHNQNLVISLQRQNEELVKANRTKTQLLSQVSHELRNPLSVITSYTQMLQEGMRGPLPTTVQGDLQLISSSAQQLTYMVDDLLALNRAELGQLPVLLEPVNLTELLRELVAAVAPAAVEKGLAVRTSLEPDCVVPGDPVRLKQVFFNLLSNALKFTDQGLVWIECSTERGRVQVRVLDSGIGIPSGVMQQLFTPFTTTALSRQRGGVGLGLAIVKRLLDLHQGDIQVRSQQGEGTEVTVLLPVYREEDSEPEA